MDHERVKLIATTIQTVIIPLGGAFLASYLVIVHSWPIDPIAGTLALGMMAQPIAKWLDGRINRKRAEEDEEA